MNNLEVGVRLTADGRGLVGEAGRAREALGGLSGEQRKASADSAAYTTQIDRQNTSLGNLKSTVLAAAGAYISFNAVIAGGRAVIDAALAQERLNNTLKVGLGSQQAATQEIAFLREESEKLGLQFATSSQQYANLTAASKGTALQGQATRDIFLAVAKASTVMGLSADQTGGALLAIEQMISKGTVSAEELRGQLGERLPGAFQIAARAMNVTTQELGEMLQRGEITAEEMLPRLAAELERTYGAEAQAAAEGLNAKINRLDNAFTDLKISIGETGLLDYLSQGITLATNFVNALSGAKVLSAVDAQKQKIAEMRQELASLNDRRHIPVIGDLIFDKRHADLLAQRIDDAIGDLDKLEKQAAETAQELAKTGAETVTQDIAKKSTESLKREAAERKKITDKAAREAKRAADAAEREYKSRVDASTRFINALMRETDEIGKNAVQKRLMAAAAEAASAPTKELAAEIMASAQAWAQATEAEEQALAEQKKLKEAAKKRADAETEAARQVQQEWNQMWSTVENTARTSFTQFAAHGVGAMESIGKSIKNAIIDLLYQLTVRKWVINIGASLGLAGGAGSALASGGGGIGSALNIASLGSGALNLFKSGFGATSALSSIGNMIPGSAGAFLSGMSGNVIPGVSSPAALSGASFGSFAGPAVAAAAVDMALRGLFGDKKLGGAAGDVLSYVPVVGTLINGLFGRGAPKFQGEALVGNVSADGFNGVLNQAYKEKGGLARSDRTSNFIVDADSGSLLNQFGRLSESGNIPGGLRDSVTGPAVRRALEVGELLDEAFGSIGNSLKQTADMLGLSTSALDGFNAELDLVSEKGKTITEQQVSDEIARISNEMAQSLIPNLDQFAKRGESAIDTVTRLGAQFGVLTDAVSVVFGQSGQAAKDIVNQFSIGDQTEFIDAAGGIENLGQKINQFFGNLDDADKLTILEDRLTTALDVVGVNFIPTMEQFNAAMQSGDLSLQQIIAGLDLQGLIKDVNDLRTALTPVSEITDKAAEATDDAAKKEQDLIRAREGAARASEKAARREAQQREIDKQAQQKQSNVEGNIKAAEDRAAKERELLKLRFDGERKILEETRKRSQEITGFIESLRRSAFDVSPLGFEESGNIIASAIKNVMSGADFASVMTERMQAAIRGAGSIDERLYSSFDEFARARGEAASQINDLASLGENQLTMEGATLAELEKQSAWLEKTYDILSRRIDSGLTFDKNMAQADLFGGIATAGGTRKQIEINKAQRQLYILGNDLEQDPVAMLRARLNMIKAQYTSEATYGGGRMTQEESKMIKMFQDLAIQMTQTNGYFKRAFEGDALNVRTVS